MRPIPPKLRKQMAEDPYYRACARKDETCKGRITWEHALKYAGKQINEAWAIIPLCWHHHLGKGLNKRINEYLAIKRATPEELAKYPRVDWEQKINNSVRRYIEKEIVSKLPKGTRVGIFRVKL